MRVILLGVVLLSLAACTGNRGIPYTAADGTTKYYSTAPKTVSEGGQLSSIGQSKPSKKSVKF